MTTHLDDELLAGCVLEGNTSDPGAADHLRHCDRCRESLADLQAVAALAARLPRLEIPLLDLWERIRGEVAGRPRPGRFGRGALALAASVAAVLGTGIGVGGTLVLTDREDTSTKIQAMTRLEPLTGEAGSGTADLVQTSAGNQLRVEASGLDAIGGFYEVWLINADGKRMVSLGVLDPRTGGTFHVPAELTSQGYQIVDVSLEPRDGNPEHSHVSVIRGTLPK